MRTYIRPLLKILCLGGLLAILPDAAFGQAAIKADSARLVRVETTGGQIRVRGWERTTLQADAAVDSAEFTWMRENDQIRLLAAKGQGALKIDLFIPAEMELEVQSVDGAIAVQGVRGAVRLKSESGAIDLFQPTGNVTAATQSGVIRALFAEAFVGRAELSSAKGDIHVTAPKINVSATSSKPIVIDGAVRVTGFTAERGYSLELPASSPGGQLQAAAPGGRVVVWRSTAAPPVRASAPPVSPPGDRTPAPVTRPGPPVGERTAGAQAPDPRAVSQAPDPGTGRSSLPPAETPAAGGRTPGEPDKRSEKYRVVGSTVDAGYSVRTSVDLVNLNLSVRDRSNRSVANLAKQDFQVYEDGKLQEVDNLLTAETPFHLLLLLDVSGSTAEFVDLMKTASVNFLRMLRPEDQVALAVFSSDTSLLVPFTNDRSEVEWAIRGIYSHGGTAFYDALEASIHDYMEGVRGRKAIVVFSDGVDNQLEGGRAGSSVTFRELMRGIQEDDTMIYPIFLDTEDEVSGGGMGRVIIDILGGGRMPRRGYPAGRGNRRDQYEQARREMQEIAEQTGGRMYSPKRIEDLEGTYRQISDDLRIQYTLSYASSNPVNDGKWRRIQVRIPRHPDYAVRTRPGYYATGKGA